MADPAPPSAPAAPDRAAVRVAVLNYGLGNLRSVEQALRHLGAEVMLARRPAEAAGARAVVLPGVGALGDCMDGLRAGGLDDFVRGWVGEGRPFLGVCLGLQALFEVSEEGGVRGLGLLPGVVRRFRLPPPLKVPHMGWNAVRFTPAAGVLAAGLADPPRQFYFVHSYYACPADPAVVAGETEHGSAFASAVAWAGGRCGATQFHPEKSQAAGLAFYDNFLRAAAES